VDDSKNKITKCAVTIKTHKVLIIIVIIIIVIFHLTIVSKDQWRDLECTYKACQAAITDEGLFTHTGLDERGENERQSENDFDMKTVS